jgi:septal ring factor EnvC (AmiA/AmiB activator)
MLFGIFEMREFAKNHEDERIKSMMRKIESLTSKLSRFNEKILEQEAELNKLNEMLNETAYGQKKIDAYVSICEENNRLKEEQLEMIMK